MRRISRMILVTAGYNFRMWKKNMRVIAAFLLAFILCFMLTDKLVLFAGKQETTMQLVEPFIWTFGDGNSILLGSMLFLLLFGDLPFITTATPFFLIRENRKIWIAGQFLYIVGACVFYLMFILGSTGILCMKYLFPKNTWSYTAAMLAYSEKGETLGIPAAVKTLEMSRLIPDDVLYLCSAVTVCIGTNVFADVFYTVEGAAGRGYQCIDVQCIWAFAESG